MERHHARHSHDPVDEAFAACPREWFLPASARSRAGYDGPLEIGHGQTNSQPRTVADMLRLLAVEQGQRVLDVGAGSGWTTALLAHLVGPTGRVHGVEVVPELVTMGQENLARARKPWAGIEQALPGRYGLPAHAPYDRILVSAMADSVPQDLRDQLAPGGRMVIPVDGWMVLATDQGDRTYGAYRFVPLVPPP